jgi:hypothetical protein
VAGLNTGLDNRLWGRFRTRFGTRFKSGDPQTVTRLDEPAAAKLTLWGGVGGRPGTGGDVIAIDNSFLIEYHTFSRLLLGKLV